MLLSDTDIKVLFKSYKWHSSGYSKYIYFNWSSSLLLTLKLKMAKIIPIFKQDDNTTLTNIGRSLCFLISTGSFRKYCLRIESFIEQKNLLTPSQYGFRKAHSTQHATQIL